MPKGWKRSWVKFWVDECLDGSIREQLTAEERCVWYDLVIYSARCRVPGVISANETEPITTRRLAAVLNLDEELLKRALVIFQNQGRVKIDSKGLFHIVSWKKYQSQYQAQKKYQLTYRLKQSKNNKE